MTSKLLDVVQVKVLAAHPHVGITEVISSQRLHRAHQHPLSNVELPVVQHTKTSTFKYQRTLNVLLYYPRLHLQPALNCLH